MINHDMFLFYRLLGFHETVCPHYYEGKMCLSNALRVDIGPPWRRECMIDFVENLHYTMQESESRFIMRWNNTPKQLDR